MMDDSQIFAEAENLYARLEQINQTLERIAMALEEMVSREVDRPGIPEKVMQLISEPETIAQSAAMVRAQALYGAGVHVAMENSKGRKFLEWCVDNNITPDLVQVGSDGVIAADVSVVQRYSH
jgi:hypothetical protein